MKLKEKWKCQWQNYINKRQKVFKPFDRSWIEIGALHSNWSKCTSRTWDVVDFVISQNCTFKERILVLFQIHLKWSFVQQHMVIQILLCLHTQPLVMVCMCIVCNACFKSYEQLERIKCVVFQSMDYMKQILANNSLHLQVLSFIDISTKIEEQNYEFMHGQIQPYRLLDNPLLYWNSKFQPTNTSKDANLALKDLLHQNLFSNPLIQKYVTNIEKPNPTHGLCVLCSSILEEILAKIGIGAFFKYGCWTFHSKFVIVFWHVSWNSSQFWWCLWNWRFNYAQQWQPF